MADQTCPIWGRPATILENDGRDGTYIDSPRAGGKYFLSGSAEHELVGMEEQVKVRLTSWLVDQRRLGNSCPEISSTVLEEARARRDVGVQARADNLLRYLAMKSDYLGTVVKFRAMQQETPDDADALLAWTASRRRSEVITLAEYASAENWIEHRSISFTNGDGNHQLMLKPPGYAWLAALDGAGSTSSQAFVAMWFDPSQAEVFEKGIATAIRDVGYEPLRIDKKDHNNKIDDEIIAEIRRSRFVVADFTQGAGGARGGVYYEAGFAHGLGIPVIFTCRNDVLKEVHFDTRQYNHIAWTTVDELRDHLAKRIAATLGDGPGKKTK